MSTYDSSYLSFRSTYCALGVVLFSADADTAPLDVAISPLDPTMVQVSVSDPTLAGELGAV